MKRELAQDGYAGAEVRVTPTRTEVIIRARLPRYVLGVGGRRIRELTSGASTFVCKKLLIMVCPAVRKRWGINEGAIELYAERVNHGLSASSICEALKMKLFYGIAVRRYSLVNF